MSASDPRDRPLVLALRSARLLGVVSTLYGIFFVFAYGYLNRYQTYAMHFIAMGMIIFVLPGVAMLAQSKQLELRYRSGAISIILAAAFQGLCAAALFIANFFFTPISVIPVVLSLLWVIAIVQMIVHLTRSLPLLAIDAERRHGFDVSTPQRVLPVQPIGDDDERSDASTQIHRG